MSLFAPSSKERPPFGTIAHLVDQPGINAVLADAISTGVCHRMMPPRGLHVTLMEPGRCDSLHGLLVQSGYKNIEFARVRDKYEELRFQFAELPQAEFQTRITGLGILGNNTLVLTLEKTTEWMEMRETLTSPVRDAIKSLGITDIEAFLASDRVLCRLNRERYIPHITLGWGICGEVAVSMPDDLSVDLVPPRFLGKRYCV